MTINLTLFAQQQTNKCFNDTEIDSIYSKLLEYKYIKQENEVLKTALTESNKIKNELNNQVVILKANESNYQLLDYNYNLMQNNLYKIIDDKDIIIKEQKKKTVKAYFKGGIVGVGIGIIFFIITQ